MSETKWKPEGFKRKQFTLEDATKLLSELGTRTPKHFEDYGAGIFYHTHEIVGCMFGQIKKLSEAADESIHDGDLTKFRERCMKTLIAIYVGTLSVDKLTELRNNTKPAQEINIVVDEPDKICGRSKAAVPVIKDEKVCQGPIRDDDGLVIRISTQKGDDGYDPEVHLNQNLKITCDGILYATAHTADVYLGKVWYYEKTAKGRIATRVVEGKVEINGI